jgi:hypothetical protein
VAAPSAGSGACSSASSRCETHGAASEPPGVTSERRRFCGNGSSSSDTACPALALEAPRAERAAPRRCAPGDGAVDGLGAAPAVSGAAAAPMRSGRPMESSVGASAGGRGGIGGPLWSSHVVCSAAPQAASPFATASVSRCAGPGFAALSSPQLLARAVFSRRFGGLRHSSQFDGKNRQKQMSTDLRSRRCW